MRILITGVTGFVGSHLADFLSQKKSVRVYGVSRQPLKDSLRRRMLARADVRYLDLRDQHRLRSLLEEIRPERIFHLAAQSSVPWSWKHPRATFDQNITATLCLLEAVRMSRLKPRMQIAGSAQEYGTPPVARKGLSENLPLHPTNPYALSKVIQDEMAQQYFKVYGIPIVRTRAFNQIGPGQSSEFMTAEFARQIALIEAGQAPALIRVGSLEAVRDFTDVRDTVKAYWLALEKGCAGEVYNIASGHGATPGQILERLLSMTEKEIKVVRDKSRFRKNEIPRLVGDVSLFRRRTGWKPKISLKTSLNDILNDWRMRIHEAS